VDRSSLRHPAVLALALCAGLCLTTRAEAAASGLRLVAVSPPANGVGQVLVEPTDARIEASLRNPDPSQFQALVGSGGAQVFGVRSLSGDRSFSVLAFDQSGSFAPFWGQAFELARGYVEGLPTNRGVVSVVTFGLRLDEHGQASTPRAMVQLLDTAKTAGAKQPQTRLKAFIRDSVDKAARAQPLASGGLREVVVFTDAGEESSAYRIEDIARHARSLGARIHVVAFYPASGGRASTSRRLDDMKRLAELSGGEYVQVDRVEEAKTRLTRLGGSIDRVLALDLSFCGLAKAPSSFEDTLTVQLVARSAPVAWTDPVPFRQSVGGVALVDCVGRPGAPVVGPTTPTGSNTPTNTPTGSNPLIGSTSPSGSSPSGDVNTPTGSNPLIGSASPSGSNTLGGVNTPTGSSSPSGSSTFPGNTGTQPGGSSTSSSSLDGKPSSALWWVLAAILLFLGFIILIVVLLTRRSAPPPAQVQPAVVAPPAPPPPAPVVAAPPPDPAPAPAPTTPWHDPFQTLPDTHLVVTKGAGLQPFYRLHKSPFTVGGRKGEVDLHIELPQVSGLHATFQLFKLGAVYVIDNQSTNGTFVDGRRLAAGERVQVKPGQIVGISRHVELRLDQPGLQPSSAPAQVLESSPLVLPSPAAAAAPQAPAPVVQPASAAPASPVSEAKPRTIYSPVKPGKE